jgi:hypothetical protein
MKLFEWQDIEELGDLRRLLLVLRYLPDEALMQALEQERGKGRDDYPVRPIWNSLVAGVVFQHETIESLRRELLRNAQLRQACGFDLSKAMEVVPPPWAYSRFLANVISQQNLVEEMFDELVDRLSTILPDFGMQMAMDGKAIQSYARGKPKEHEGKQDPGHRRDEDAEWGVHEHRGEKEDGSSWEKVKIWFGYTLHLIVDSRYELPIGFEVTKAGASEVKQAHRLIDEVGSKHPHLLQRCEELSADRGYDDGKLIEKLWDKRIAPVVDIRNCWRDGEETKLVKGCENVIYDYKGTVSCVCLRSGEQRQMAYGGFEKDRGTLKYRCPAHHYEMECVSTDTCPVGKAVRIPMSEDRRIFTPVARSSYKWPRLYAHRTAVERVNSRLDVSFGFEKHTIRGLDKMKTRCALALCIMLAMAVGRIMENQKELMRSLVMPACA